MKVLLKGMKIVDPSTNKNEQSDILIEDGIIAEIGEISESKADKVFEFDNLHCVPGFYDMHVHFREPGREDKETIRTGSNAAANGGFTGVACMPNTTPAIDSAEVVKF
ncbi:MAG: amidohydrolase family protein, partial [Chlorobi bacterium]|nr:amidohydrolase family protein [Chlorobiota bacterium]